MTFIVDCFGVSFFWCSFFSEPKNENMLYCVFPYIWHLAIPNCSKSWYDQWRQNCQKRFYFPLFGFQVLRSHLSYNFRAISVIQVVSAYSVHDTI